MDFQTLETARKEYAKRIKRLFIPVAIMLVVMVFGSLLSGALTGGGRFFSPLTLVAVVFIITTILLIIFAFTIQKYAKAYKSAYKTYFVSQTLGKVFTDVQYDHTAGIQKEVLKNTGMVRLGNVYSSNDYFTAKYHDVALRQADVDIKERYTDSDGNTHYITIFKGRWMIFEFPKPFSFRLQVIQKHFNAGKKAGKDRETGRKLKKISTESITFDKEFTVLAEDDFEAYYILDPAFIDHIEQLAAGQKGRIMLCFKDKELHVAINNGKDAFEAPSPFKTIDETAEFTKIAGEVKTITDYVDYLKLDRKLFTNSTSGIISS